MWDWTGAELEFKQAIKLDPGYAIAHHWYSNYLMYMGRFDESFNELDIALKLDPFSLIMNRDLGELYYFSRKYDKAVEQFLKAIEIDPNFIYLHADLGISYLLMGRNEEALTEIQKEPSDIWLAIAYAHMGKEDKAKKILSEQVLQSEKSSVSPYLLALFYFALGETENGFECLNKAYAEHNNWLIYTKIEPLLDNARSDQRFKDMMIKMNFEES